MASPLLNDEESSEEMEIRVNREAAARSKVLDIEESSDLESSGKDAGANDTPRERKDSLQEAQYLKGNLF